MSAQGKPAQNHEPDDEFNVDPASFDIPNFRYDAPIDAGDFLAVITGAGSHIAAKSGARFLKAVVGIMPIQDGADGRRIDAYIDPIGQGWKEFLAAANPKVLKGGKFRARDVIGQWVTVRVEMEPDANQGGERPRIKNWFPYVVPGQTAPRPQTAPPPQQQQQRPAPGRPATPQRTPPPVADDDIPF